MEINTFSNAHMWDLYEKMEMKSAQDYSSQEQKEVANTVQENNEEAQASGSDVQTTSP